jgi:signal peptidase I
MGARRILGLLATGAVIAGVAIAWIELAPAELGGRVSYVMIQGASMRPALGPDDLALVRPAGSYRPGDVIAYRSRTLDRVVLHRIVAADGASFVTRGDANGYVDPDPVAQGDIIGRLWTTVPFGGAVLGWVREPTHAALLAGGATLLLAAIWLGAASRRRRRQPPRSGPGRRTASPRSGGPVAIAGVGFVAAAAAALAVAAYLQPSERVQTLEGAYTQRGAFSYSGPARAGAAYPEGVVSSGQPLFRRLVDRIDVAFSYRLEPTATPVRGSAALTAILADASGWQQRFTLAPAAPFTDASTTVSGTLDLARIWELLRQLEQETGSAPTLVTLSVVPDIRVEGTAGGGAFQDRFAPSLTFDVGEESMQLHAGGDGEPASLERADVGSVSRIVPGVLSVTGIDVGVQTARLAATGILGVTLAFLALALVHGRGATLTEAERIDRRHRGAIVPIEWGDDDARRIVDVATIDALARIADHHDALLLHRHDGDRDEYLVEAGESTYRYRTAPQAPAPRAQGPASAGGRAAGATPAVSR